MVGIIGKKLGMTSIFNENGDNIPCTVIEAVPCTVTHLKNSAGKEGYNAVQLSVGEIPQKHWTKAAIGHFKKANTDPKLVSIEFKNLRKFKSVENIQLGEKLTIDIFTENEWVDVTNYPKGKGFQGVVKRHGFSGVGGRTHGQHNRGRHPGSMGASSYPSKVVKGMRMAGHKGGNQVKILNLIIARIDKEKNLLFLKGAIPGPRGSYLKIEK